MTMTMRRKRMKILRSRTTRKTMRRTTKGRMMIITKLSSAIPF
jgi:hypothetical protein